MQPQFRNPLQELTNVKDCRGAQTKSDESRNQLNELYSLGGSLPEGAGNLVNQFLRKLYEVARMNTN
jgi:hypothetical protein